MPIFQSPAGQITVPRHINAGTLITLTPGAGATVTLEYTLADMPAIINRTADWQVWSKGAATAPLQDMIMQAMYVRTTSIGGAGSTYTTDPFPTAEQMRAYRATFGGTTQAAQAVITGGKSVGSIATASPANGYSFTAGQWYADGVAISGQTALTYTRLVGDIGKTLTFVPTLPVYAASGGGTVAPLTSPSPPVTLLPLNSRLVCEGDSQFNAGTVASDILAHSMLTGGRFYMPSGYNQATASETVAQMLTQVSAINARQPDVVLFRGGTNDLGNGVRAINLIRDDIKACADAYLAGGAKVVVIMEVLNRNDTSWLALSQARRDDRVALNLLIRALDNGTTIRVVRVDDAVFDPSIYTFDGLHQTWDGSFLMGAAFAAVTNTLIVQDSILDFYLDAANFWPNPQLTGTAGAFAGSPTPTGQVSDQHTLNTSGTGLVAVGSKVANANGVAIGDRVVVSGTPDAAARGVTILKTCTIPGAIGDAYEAWCQFDLAAGSAFIRAINISMSGVGQTPNRGVDKIMSALPRSGVLRCPPYILTTNAASIQVSFGCQFGLGATAADFTISKPVLRKVTGANALNP